MSRSSAFPRLKWAPLTGAYVCCVPHIARALCDVCVRQGAAKLASNLVGTVWAVLDDMAITPALHNYCTGGADADAAE